MTEKQSDIHVKLTDRARTEIESRIARSKVKNPVLGMSFGNERHKYIHTGKSEKTFTGWMINVFDEEQFRNVDHILYVNTDAVRIVLITQQFKEDVANRTIDYRGNHFYVE